MNLKNAHIIVIKIGSSSLVDDEFNLRSKWLASLVSDIAELHNKGVKIIIVSSGAVALGRFKITKTYRKLKLEEKQAAAAIGQPLLMASYNKKFAEHEINTAQILLTISDIENRKRYLNAKNTLETLFENKIIPIINENDSVATDELKLGDNDRLSAMVAQMVFADKLIIFSDIAGLYTDDPNKNKDAKLISVVEKIDAEIEKIAKGAKSKTGTGGMFTKIQAAKIASASGCETIITFGKNNNPLAELQKDSAKFTSFKPMENAVGARKKWILNSINTKGSVKIDEGAEAALRSGKSLLPIGVASVSGSFLRGDKISIQNEKSVEIAKGISTYASKEIDKIKRKKNSEIEATLGYAGKNYLIHADDLVLV